MRSTKQFDYVTLSQKLIVTTEELQALLSCGRPTAVEIGSKAEARIQIGKRVFWNIGKIKEYLTLISY